MERRIAIFLSNVFALPTLTLHGSKLTITNKLVILAAVIACLQLLLRLGCISEYGLHQDELLYLALSDHLAWGYREVPPFIALVGMWIKATLGDTIVAVRIIPSLCAAAIVFVTGLMTIRLGGKFLAVGVACISVAFSPAFLAAGALFIPQVFDELCWVLVAYLLLVALQDKNERLLIFIGILAGIGLLIKYTLLLFFGGLAIGLLLQAEHRYIFAHRLLWLGLLLGALLCLPHFWWQYQHGFPALSHYHELKQTQLIYLSRFDFLLQQLLVNGTAVIVWLAGLAAVFSKRFKSYRFFGVAFVVVMLSLFALNGKAYYGFGCFPPLFALGAVALSRQLSRLAATAIYCFFAFLVLPNLALALVVMPYLPIEKAAKVFEWTSVNLGIHYPLKWEDQKVHNMNQNYADMIGWDELANKTALLYLSLPADTRKKTIVLAEKYGEASAIHYYQSQMVLPPVISLNSSYAIWAPPTLNVKHIIYIGMTPLPKFIRSQKVAQIENPYARVVGMQICLITDVNPSVKSWYQQHYNLANKQSAD